MTDIGTTTNTEWSIISAVKSALSSATISGAAVFQSVTATTSEAQAGQAQFKGTPPLVIVRYLTSAEDGSVGDSVGCAVEAELIIATKVDAGPDESTRLQEVLRLMNAAKNAVEASPPATAHAWGDADFYHDRIVWGRPQIDVTTRRPLLANNTGGLSGPAIHPVAVYMVHRVYTEVARAAGIPLIAMGGVQHWRDAVEFLLAGATGVAVGTALFTDPACLLHIRDGIAAYCAEQGAGGVGEIIGTLTLNE